jgi:predicted dehydrogenase
MARKDYGIWKEKSEKEAARRRAILNELDIEEAVPVELSGSGDRINIGIIGFGIRGPHLAQALGFMHPDRFNDWSKNQPERIEAFNQQEDLNVRITAICDLFDHNVEKAIETVTRSDNQPKVYPTYQDLIENSGVDALIIATADYWHVPIAIAAARAGIHIYLEKPASHNLTETYALKKAVEESGIVFQLGHQHRQTQSFITAREIVQKNVLGHISLTQANTNRNNDGGAWQYNMYEEFPDSSIRWNQYIGEYRGLPFSRELFFRWRKYWKFGSGLTGDLLSHDYDRINCLLEMGIPASVSASGGIYTHRDGREVPDVVQVAMEFPDYFNGSSQPPGKEKGMTFLYSATLGNNFNRKTLLMGHDASLDLGQTLTVWADPGSSRYEHMIKDGVIDPEAPIYSFNPSLMGEEIDAISSATTQYFADKGLLFDYRDGKRVDSAHLHLKEWLHAIRNGTPVSANINVGFEEAISCIMATLATKTGRKVYWDHAARQMSIEGMNRPDFDRLLKA